MTTNSSPFFKKEHLLEHIKFSLFLNFLGYIEAILISVSLGIFLGYFKSLRTMFTQQIDALRFVPITALSGVLIAISGLTLQTKIHFLALGIGVYLIPVTIQRIDETPKIHLQMMQTLGATKLQTLWWLILPYIKGKLSDDIRILIGISWTYIIIAEMKNDQGGLGHLIFLADKRANSSISFDVIFLIMFIGILQDFLLKQADKFFLKYKYV